jgi:hypothetical protein
MLSHESQCTQERRMEKEPIFIQGFAAALAEICRRGHTTIAANILRTPRAGDARQLTALHGMVPIL